MASPNQWGKVAAHLVGAGLWEPIAEEDIFRVRRQRVVAGAMAVDKGWDERLQLRAQRLIVDMVPQNAYQVRISGAAGEFPYVTQAALLIAPPRDLL